VIAEGVKVLELDLCSKYKEELFLYELKKPFNILIYRHIYHHSCLEDYVKDLLQCSEYAIKIEYIDYMHYSDTSEPSSQNRAQNTSDLMQISLQMIQSIKSKSKKRLYEKGIKKKPTNLKKLIDKLTTENFDSAENIIIMQSSSIPVSESDLESVDFFSSYYQV
ncbi:2173_t:CDS:2, partial [Racocetra fulgida]